jgi:hypothetical protein
MLRKVEDLTRAEILKVRGYTIIDESWLNIPITLCYCFMLNTGKEYRKGMKKSVISYHMKMYGSEWRVSNEKDSDACN